jgi:hypothetical protein
MYSFFDERNFNEFLFFEKYGKSGKGKSGNKSAHVMKEKKVFRLGIHNS